MGTRTVQVTGAGAGVAVELDDGPAGVRVLRTDAAGRVEVPAARGWIRVPARRFTAFVGPDDARIDVPPPPRAAPAWAPAAAVGLALAALAIVAPGDEAAVAPSAAPREAGWRVWPAALDTRVTRDGLRAVLTNPGDAEPRSLVSACHGVRASDGRVALRWSVDVPAPGGVARAIAKVTVPGLAPVATVLAVARESRPEAVVEGVVEVPAGAEVQVCGTVSGPGVTARVDVSGG